MKAVDFYKLGRSIQDRFVGSVTSGFPPEPILAKKSQTPLKLIWLGVTVACFLVLVIVARVGYGSLDSSFSRHSGKALVLYSALVFGIAFGLVMAFARLVREKALPYAAGVYLFPACVIDARSDQFKVLDTKDLASCDAQGGQVRVAFSGGQTFLFPVPEGQDAQKLVADVNTARDRTMRARATEDPSELVAVDPLHNPRFSSPVGPRDPYALRRPPWNQFGWAVAAVITVAFGPALWALRNSGSDNRMYTKASTADDVASYRQYLEHGEGRKEEVASILLPRAELREAQRTGTVEALLEYKATHPGVKIAGEMNLAIRAAMLEELDKAKAKGTLGALQEFAKKYPEHGVEPELRAATHAVYTRELETYKKRAPTRDKTALPFVERLFQWGEKHGPKIEVRFRRKASASLEKADTYLVRHPNFMGVVTYPSRFFTDKYHPKREEALSKSLLAAFDQGLSPELFEVAMGATIPADAETLPEVKLPTLFVTHVAEWSTHTYISQSRPRGVFIGIQFNFEAVFTIPDNGKPYKFTDKVFKHAAIGVVREEDPPLGPGAAEEKIYDAMAMAAFDEFGKRLLSVFFKERPKADPGVAP
jgi:hypothetical protein